jgi:predicted HD phosphohydrolase
MRTVDEILTVLARGAEHFDEPSLDVLSHSLQCATLLGEEGGDDELVAAGLVHDIADAEHAGDHTAHEVRGAELVTPVLGPRVGHLVEMHVAAKRYLVTTDDEYRSRLSPRSIETLVAQGDVLDTTEIEQMRRNPDLDAILTLRRADERAKVLGASVAPLESWRPLLERLASGQRLRQTK